MSKYNRPGFWLVGGLLLLGGFLRLYRLPQTAIFQGDQGRDAIIVQRLIKDFHPPLIGPVTSVGNMYLGPLYYYFMAPWLWLTYPSPLGPVYGVAILSVFGLYLTYRFGKEMFSNRVALLALFFTAIMPSAVVASRFSWNPNLQPVVSLVLLWALFRALKRGQPAYLVLATTAFAILIQLHYMALVTGGLIVFTAIYGFTLHKKSRKQWLVYLLLSLGVLGLSWLPLFIFDLTHNHLIWQGFVKFLLSPDQHLAPLGRLLIVIRETEGRAVKVLIQLLGIMNWPLGRWLSVMGMGLFIWSAYLKRAVLKDDYARLLIMAGLIITIAATAFYTGSVFDHYLLFAVPITAFFWSLNLDFIWSFGPAAKAGVGILLAVFGIYTFIHEPTFDKPGPTMAFYQRVAQTIAPHIRSGPYNLVVFSENKDLKGMTYRYFLQTTSHPPESIDTYTNLNQLVVIDELAIRDPLSAKIFEIQTPHLTHLDNSFSIPSGPTVYIYN